jgi:peptidoglycan/LPS O-acetylase OafA/YrhL
VILIGIGFQKYLSGSDLLGYAKSIIAGVALPSLPNGGWSLTVEFHFYLILPLFLFLTSKWKYSLVFVLVAAICVRVPFHQELGQIQSLSYWTIVGRIDQFLLGIMAYQFRKNISGRHLFIFSLSTLFAIFYWHFDSQGGFFMSPSYPSPNAIWIFMPTIEGVVYALTIAWYDNSFTHSTGKFSRFLALIGTYSYSIYLLHLYGLNEMAAHAWSWMQVLRQG